MLKGLRLKIIIIVREIGGIVCDSLFYQDVKETKLSMLFLVSFVCILVLLILS